jgi:hypothetical protein
MERKRTTESFIATGRSLEEAFFLEQDRELIQRRAELHSLERTKEALASVSGMKDQAILEQLVRLGVGAETLAALAVVPLIEVVWADGHVDDEERQVVLDHAEKQGILPGGIEYALLERWLLSRPGDDLLAAWQHYVEALCERLDGPQRAALKNELLEDVRAAAEASGGFLGFGSVSDEEKVVLDKLEGSFCG